MMSNKTSYMITSNTNNNKPFVVCKFNAQRNFFKNYLTSPVTNDTGATCLYSPTFCMAQPTAYFTTFRI